MKNKKILIAAPNYWTSPFQVGSHHYARIFARNGWEVLFISDPISSFHFLVQNKQQVYERKNIYRGHIKSGFKNIHIYVPFALFTPNDKPFFRSAFVTNNWQRFTVPDIFKYLGKIDFSSVDVIWFDSLIQSFLIDKINYKKSIFRVSDKLEAFKKISSNISILEKKLLEKIDIIIYTAKTLKDYIKRFEEKSFYIPNGVDFQHFKNAEKKIPDDLKEIPRPRAIYVGAIDEWFAQDYLISVARKCKNFSFILIGTPNIDVSKIKREQNIYLLGRKSYSEIPSYIFNSDVGIITFDINHPVVNTVNPIKLYEYMACGIPVVTTKWKELELINSPAYLASNVDDFIYGLNYSLANFDKKKGKNKIIYKSEKQMKRKERLEEGNLIREELVNFAQANSWEKRFEEIIKILNQQIN
ncbi:MAG: glycosyltransferase family 1 protein [Actinobacteria bacterium]|nr:glycosyltransferase family 1 protein [Actinomycetota bacterium]MBM3712112.1 glycosyltransferase family 1 protein [Actinomycetota bacterium]